VGDTGTEGIAKAPYQHCRKVIRKYRITNRIFENQKQFAKTTEQEIRKGVVYYPHFRNTCTDDRGNVAKFLKISFTKNLHQCQLACLRPTSQNLSSGGYAEYHLLRYNAE
jgi:hypothetical protein